MILRVQTAMTQDHDRFFPPLLHRDQWGVEFEVEIARDVGAVVGTADMRHHPLDLRNRANHLTQPRRHSRGFLECHRARQQGANPEVALLQRRHEFAAQLGNQRDRESQERPHRRQQKITMIQNPVEHDQIAQLHDPIDKRLFLFLFIMEQERAEHRGQRHGQ